MNKLLTRSERLILMNQFRILASMGGSESYTEYECENIALILENGYEYFYDEFLPNDLTVFSVKESNFVMAVLTIYREIDTLLKSDDCVNIKNRSDLIFPGFDANEESSYYHFCWFVVQKMNRFFEQKDRFNRGLELSTIEPMIPKYLRMIAARNKIKTNKITEHDAAAILDA